MKKQQFTVWKRNFKKTVFALGIGLCAMGVSMPAVMAKQVDSIEGHPIFDNLFKGVEVDESSDGTFTKRSASYAVKYDPRTLGNLTAIEDQGETNTCWAFSTIAAIEENLIKKGYEDSSLNLSENHLAYFFYNRQTDPVGYTAGDYNRNLGGAWYMNGGSLQGTATSLTTWSGVVKQTTSEDDGEGVYVPNALPAGDCYKSDYRVKNLYFYNYDVNTIKQAIMDYGAVATGIYVEKEYWNTDTAGYYCTKKEGNHAVTIVGWDDNYSKTNFNRSPGRNGAWIVKNSWGTGWGEDGYMYVSYEDASLMEIVAFDMEKTSDSYDHNYQYDGTAHPTAYFYYANGTKYANVFKVKGDKNGYNETLKAVSVETFTENAKYSLQIYTGVTGSGKPTSGKAMFSKPQTGTLTDAGYNRITLKKPVTLTAGEKYAVVITFQSQSGSPVYVACDTTTYADWIGFESMSGSKQSYVYYNNKWYDLGNQLTANLRIKAYTDSTNQKTQYKLSSNNLGISKGSSANLSLTINPSSVKRKVTWSSSNKKVATVSSSGKVKAVSYGTATIKAKFVAGGSTKTLKCKVTVGPSKVKSVAVKGSKKKLTVTWKNSGTAQGYVIYYSKNKKSGYKKLTTVKSGSTTKYTKSKMKKGTYYIKMCPYMKQGGKTLYGSSTGPKKVTVK